MSMLMCWPTYFLLPPVAMNVMKILIVVCAEPAENTVVSCRLVMQWLFCIEITAVAYSSLPDGSSAISNC